MQQRHPGLIIIPSDIHGLGVFTTQPIKEGEVIEICPVLVLPPSQLASIHQSDLHDYYFLWKDGQDHCGIVLGYGSIYNHSYQPNAEYVPDYEGDRLSIFCYKNIEVGEEIFLNYNGDPRVQNLVWFDEKEGTRR